MAFSVWFVFRLLLFFFLSREIISSFFILLNLTICSVYSVYLLFLFDSLYVNDLLVRCQIKMIILLMNDYNGNYRQTKFKTVKRLSWNIIFTYEFRNYTIFYWSSLKKKPTRKWRFCFLPAKNWSAWGNRRTGPYITCISNWQLGYYRSGSKWIVTISIRCRWTYNIRVLYNFYWYVRTTNWINNNRKNKKPCRCSCKYARVFVITITNICCNIVEDEGVMPTRTWFVFCHVCLKCYSWSSYLS